MAVMITIDRQNVFFVEFSKKLPKTLSISGFSRVLISGVEMLRPH